MGNMIGNRADASIPSDQKEEIEHTQIGVTKNRHNSPPLLAIPQDQRDKLELIQSRNSNEISEREVDLDDNKKRWIIVGICIHTLLSPVLRKYVESKLIMLYQTLVSTHKIDTQTYPNQYTAAGVRLFYGNINNNQRLHGRQFRNYDMRILNPVDLAKIHLPTSLAKFTGFDESCDSSALLNLLINPCLHVFSSAVHISSQKMLTNVRNDWAHCNFNQWGTHKYQEAYASIETLIRDLGLASLEENKVLGELDKWAKFEYAFLSGTTLGLEIVNEIRNQTSALAEYVLTLTSESEASLSRIKLELDNVKDQLNSRVEIIEKKQQNMENEAEIITTELGRRRYISRSVPDSLSFGYGGNYSSYLPSNGFTGPSLSVYGSGLPSYDLMSKYTSKSYDSQSTPYSYGSGSSRLGESSRYGTSTGSYYGTSYDSQPSAHGGSTYDGRSFGTDENIRVPPPDTSYDRFRDTTYRSDSYGDPHSTYTQSKLEEYVPEPSSHQNWRDNYSQKYRKYSDRSIEDDEIHRPYRLKSGHTEHKDEHVSSDLEEPSPSYYSRYRERHKKDRDNLEKEHNIDNTSAFRSHLTPREKLAIIRERILKQENDELEKPSFDLSHDPMHHSVSNPLTMATEDHSENIPRWRQRKALEDLTHTDSNKAFTSSDTNKVFTSFDHPKGTSDSSDKLLSKKYEREAEKSDHEKRKHQEQMEKSHMFSPQKYSRETDRTDTMHQRTVKLDNLVSGTLPTEAPSDSSIAEWRRRRQEWEQQASRESQEKLEPVKQKEIRDRRKSSSFNQT